jgi:hypothetical protein
LGEISWDIPKYRSSFMDTYDWSYEPSSPKSNKSNKSEGKKTKKIRKCAAEVRRFASGARQVAFNSAEIFFSVLVSF